MKVLRAFLIPITIVGFFFIDILVNIQLPLWLPRLDLVFLFILYLAIKEDYRVEFFLFFFCFFLDVFDAKPLGYFGFWYLCTLMFIYGVKYLNTWLTNSLFGSLILVGLSIVNKYLMIRFANLIFDFNFNFEGFPIYSVVFDILLALILFPIFNVIFSLMFNSDD